MAGSGGNHTPKPPGQRRRTNADPVPWATVEPDGELRGPELPDGLVEGGWHPQTVQWWQTWRCSPQAQTFIGTDWDFLLDTALLHHALWNGRLDLAGEVRLRAGQMAATPEGRLKNRMMVQLPGEESQLGSAQPARDRREHIRVVGE
jgi:hypothetical protein